MAFGIDILNLKPTTINASLKGKYTLIYGEPKIGKTTLANKFPKALVCALEPGTNALVNANVVPIVSWGELKEVVSQLGSDDAKELYDTIVIDTADIAWDYCEKYICLQNKVTNEYGVKKVPKNVGEIPYGAGWGLQKKEYDNLFVQIAMMGYGIVFISHEALVETEMLVNGETVKITKATPTLSKGAKLIVNRLVDIIAYMGKVQTESGMERKLFTRATPKFDAGSRFTYLAPQFDATYEALVENINIAVKKELEEHGLEEVTAPNSFYREGRSFEEAMEEARQIWGKIFSVEDEEVKIQRLKLVEQTIYEIFGRTTKMSDIEPHEQDLLELLISQLKHMANS